MNVMVYAVQEEWTRPQTPWSSTTGLSWVPMPDPRVDELARRLDALESEQQDALQAAQDAEAAALERVAELEAEVAELKAMLKRPINVAVTIGEKKKAGKKR